MFSVNTGASLFTLVLMRSVLHLTVQEMSHLENRLMLWRSELLYIVYEHAVRAPQRVVRVSIKKIARRLMCREILLFFSSIQRNIRIERPGGAVRTLAAETDGLIF
jgi:hypothetical protein